MALSQLVRNGFDEVAVVVHKDHTGFRDVGGVQIAAQNGVLQVPGSRITETQSRPPSYSVH